MSISSISLRGDCTIVESRSANVLISTANDIVRTGSIIHLDEWKAYSTFASSSDYDYKTVRCKFNFVGSNFSVHTKHVESYNNKLKIQI